MKTDTLIKVTKAHNLLAEAKSEVADRIEAPDEKSLRKQLVKMGMQSYTLSLCCEMLSQLVANNTEGAEG